MYTIATDAVVTTDGYEIWESPYLVPAPVPARRQIFILCGGPNARKNSMFELSNSHPNFECVDFDISNGQSFDIADCILGRHPQGCRRG